MIGKPDGTVRLSGLFGAFQPKVWLWYLRREDMTKKWLWGRVS
jgi:hypothetical protein